MGMVFLDEERAATLDLIARVHFRHRHADRAGFNDELQVRTSLALDSVATKAAASFGTTTKTAGRIGPYKCDPIAHGGGFANATIPSSPFTSLCSRNLIGV